MKTIGAHIIAHNCVENDYCLEECIRSVAPICDRIIVVECESTDATPDLLDRLAQDIPQLVVAEYEWKPSRNLEWIREIVKHTKFLVNTDWYVSMDADEVLSRDQLPAIRRHVDEHGRSDVCGSFYRHTFWKDAQHVIPHGVVCNHICARLGPLKQALSGDIINPKRTVRIPVDIWHYGHLRKREAWARKSAEMHKASFGEVPIHWKKALNGDFSGVDKCVPENTLIPYKRTHPNVAHKWLQERGYKP